MTKEEIVQGLYRGDNKAIKEAIKALEQRPSEDCVSRQAVLDKAWDVPYEGTYVQVVDVGDIQELPSVIPTHGTCKDCSHYDPLTCNSGTCLNPNMQWSNEVSATHYCADFEKVR